MRPSREKTAVKPDSGEQIVVTAQKRSEKLLTTPVSVSVVTAREIQRLAATQLRDFATTIPGLNYISTGAGQNTINIRGVTTGLDITPTVGIYVDDIPYGSSSAFAGAALLSLDAGLFDLQRIEVLRGPQGTLYGASTMGGLIKYVTVEPNSDALSGSVNSGVSTTQGGGIGFTGNTVLNIPLVKDKLAVRIDDYYTRDAGYINNVGLARDGVNQTNLFGARGEVLYTPTDDLDIKLTAAGQNVDRDGIGQVDRYINSQEPVDGTLDQDRLSPEAFNERFRLYAGNVTYRTPYVDLTSVTSWQNIKTHIAADYSSLYVPLAGELGYDISVAGAQLDRVTEKFTQEIRLASPGHHPLEWLVGGFYTHEDSANMQAVEGDNAPLGTPVLNLAQINLPSVYDEYAAFGDLTYHITSKLDITGGLRFADNEQSYQQNSFGALLNGSETGASHENVLTYLANIRYKITPDMMVYARFASGYRPGGPNFVARDPTTGALLAPATFQ